MQLAYIDTSAFIKRFVVESGSHEVEALIASAKYRLTLSSLSLTEIRAVLKRHTRSGVITAYHARKAIEQTSLELASNAVGFQAVDGFIFNLAGDIIEGLTAPLGTLDAVHLACAKAARCEVMITADKQLQRAASEAGLRVVDLI
jgi:uncharacterized protein